MAKWHWFLGGMVCLTSRSSVFLVVCLLMSQTTPLRIPRHTSSPSQATSQTPWKSAADKALSRFKQSDVYGAAKPRPKNMIIFIGDGMNTNTITAARYLKAQMAGGKAGDSQLHWESWPAVSLVRTFSFDRMTTDSGAAATAFLAGVKGRHLTIGVTSDIECCNCSEIPVSGQAISSLTLARQAGLSVGIVTTTTITHATPAAAYAHTNSRYWEYDAPSATTTNQAHACEDIASQLVRNALDFNVLFGGGAGYFYPNSTTGPFGSQGHRLDERNLLTEWNHAQAKRNRSYRAIYTADELSSLANSTVDYVLGLFADKHMDYDILRKKQPSLSEMMEAAIRVLSRNPRGYLLLVEGGRIDHAHHDNQAKLAVTDALALEHAVLSASKLVSSNDTLMVVTADHSHSFGLAGYATRQRSIFDTDDTQEANDGMPYLIAGYFNGPAAAINGSRVNPLEGDRFSHEYQQQPLVPVSYSTHSPEDVALYSTGPYNELFDGVMDNTFISHATKFTLCLQPYNTQLHCQASGAGKCKVPSYFYLLPLVVIWKVFY